ncbi:hypothetical protein K501DRAFT_257365 [Backusella circina FSU 941]|nr:hypothetical protein K501DRAFT_257365 [Backusella circina FSU 941]
MSDSIQPTLTWLNVGEASTFILVAAIISLALGTKLELSLIVSGIRCVVQLSLMGMVLDDVLKSKQPGVVILMSVVFVLLGSYETVFNRTKKTIQGMFLRMFFILLISNLLISFIGTAFVLKEKPFWSPPTFIPVVGMLLGNSMSSVAMATERCLDQFSTHAPVLETRLSYGASRYEATKPLAVDAIRISLLPVITQLSVMGMINIPGMMTGQIMAGTPIFQAVIYQQCIMFMVAASSVLGVIMAVVSCLAALIDKEQTMRPDRILDNKSVYRHFTAKKLKERWNGLKSTFCFSKSKGRKIESTGLNNNIPHEVVV